jgi:histidyl-tRNA synthetase
MSRSARLERVKGVNDILPPAAARQRAVEDRLLRLFAGYGYMQLDVPILEHTDLYLRKSGEDTLARLYSFSYQNRKLSLRPEMTASVVRAYVESLQPAPLPVRLAYSGPVFRYEAPQHSRYRQFTQVGLELVGASGAAADAETMALAVRGLETVGVDNYRLVVGHIGVLMALLRSLEMDERLVTTLAANMEALQGQGRDRVYSRLADLFPQWAGEAASAGEDADSLALAALVRTLGEEKARTAVLELLGAMNVGLEGSRSREEIVDRVLAKFAHTRQRPQIEQALGLMEELAQIKGAPDAALAGAAGLLARRGVTSQPVDNLRQALDALDAYAVKWERIGLDFALSRGLQYYTGLMFEVYHEGTTGERQLCGGGRYDDLVTTLGGSRETPAIGFAYGLERVLLAIDVEGRVPAPQNEIQILLVPVEQADHAYAVEVATALRSDGLVVEMDVKGRGVKGNLQHANRQGIPTVVVAGSRERDTRSVVVRDMASHTEKRVTLEELRVSGIGHGQPPADARNPEPETRDIHA